MKQLIYSDFFIVKEAEEALKSLNIQLLELGSTLKRKAWVSEAVCRSSVTYLLEFFEYERPTPAGESKYIMLDT